MTILFIIALIGYILAAVFYWLRAVDKKKHEITVNNYDYAIKKLTEMHILIDENCADDSGFRDAVAALREELRKSGGGGGK